MRALRIWWSRITRKRGKVGGKRFIALSGVPGFALIIHETCQSLFIEVAILAELRVASNLSILIVKGLSVSGYPDLPWRQIEVEKIIDRLG